LQAGIGLKFLILTTDACALVPFGRNGEFVDNESAGEQPKVQAACTNYLSDRKEYVISKHLKAAKVYSTSFSP